MPISAFAATYADVSGFRPILMYLGFQSALFNGKQSTADVQSDVWFQSRVVQVAATASNEHLNLVQLHIQALSERNENLTAEAFLK